ncbi:similar to Saccharomyces cerevisiae YKL038W RGT1 (ohnolog of YBR033W EDS1) Glucose-responsive transcription factor [Maudiozyma saulgeensis]|uniref:Similar to Saccharomyces cerevisiae YKL038W RGT1 (Ohnolog of YBR033W EDS1) Glucose-responsive transcription factor n=1 Tax=Maudiozyma saulgeensis TaxID=1789683 RepID=A0A1X7QXK2_9SACH|nr:similar to Saccharomyces cerevisiae YKL038W RGT1 (ohnolog of YBR033W EDS1) Glucose-responsive transcription factor [Kazachstania saulgeensis]
MSKVSIDGIRTKSNNSQDKSTNKKRTKASRACDQCRKKKIKCDYNDEKAICTHCSRNNEACTFERVPLKRGPSKGYHKSTTKKNKINNTNIMNTVDPLNPGIIQGGNTATTIGNDQNSMVTPTTLIPSGNIGVPSVFAQTNDNTPSNEQLVLMDNNNNNNNKVIPRTPSRSNSASILLPPLSQYMPPSIGSRTGSVSAGANNDLGYGPTTTNNNNNTTSIAVAGVTTTSNNNNGGSNTNNFGVLNINNSSTLPNFNLGQQQFWKVPYHEFSHKRKGSIDSLSSDISVRNVNQQDQFYMNTGNNANTSQNMKKTSSSGYNNSIGSGSTSGSNYWSFFKSTANINNPPNNIVTPTNNNTNNIIATNNNNNNNNNSNDDTQSERSRGSSLIPSIIRQTSNSVIMGGQPQLPPPSSSPALQPQNSYSYFQFQQHQLQSLNGNNNNSNSNNNNGNNPNSINPNNYNPSLTMFSQYATTGFQSRNNSITSDAMSPSSSSIYPPVVKQNLAPTAIESTKISLPPQNLTNHNRNNENLDYNKVSSQREPSPSIKIRNNSNNNRLHRNSSVASIESLLSGNDMDSNSDIKNRNRNNSANNTSAASDSNVQKNELSKKSHDMIGKPQEHIQNTAGNVILYGQISDIELINLYYEFIHVGFPIIPLNKRTLTNDILLVNTQPISSIHELNNYVILWFRNSLELLVRVALKKENKNDHFFDNKFSNPFDKFKNLSSHQNNNESGTKNDIKPDGTTDGENELPTKELFEVQSIFIAALNECFQKIVDIHPKFRENKDIISPKIKIIYLSTLLILNYILGYVGYDNSFVLGMSVTIFNEFKLYKLLILPENDSSGYYNIFRGSLNDIPTGSIDSSIDENERLENIQFERDTLVIFKRLYISLIIFDSLQSCTFGGPKLLNISVDKHMIDAIFNSLNESINAGTDDKWCLDEDPIRLKIIVQNLKLGVLLSQLSMNRVSLNSSNNTKNVDLTRLVWLPEHMAHSVEMWNKENESDALPHHVVNHKHRESRGSLCGSMSEITTMSALFSAVIQTKQYLINYLISINHKSDPNFKMTIDMTGVIADTLCSLLKQILKLLTLMMRTNSVNSIDPNNRPSLSPATTHMAARTGSVPDDNTDAALSSIPTAASMTMNAATPNVPPSGRSTTPITNDFYQKLLGLDGDGSDSSGANKGTVSLFGISIFHELYNLTNIIKQLPTVLIRVVMKISYTDNLKAQAQVVKLSNSLNEVVQIVSLLSLMKPFKMFESESLKDKALTMDGEFNPELSLKWKYISKSADIYSNVDVASDEWIIARFINVGWMLLDDAELGWYQ